MLEKLRSVNLRCKIFIGPAPGLVVIGEESCLRGQGFESWRRILDGHFLH